MATRIFYKYIEIWALLNTAYSIVICRFKPYFCFQETSVDYMGLFSYFSSNRLNARDIWISFGEMYDFSLSKSQFFPVVFL